jgi:hypothetical protein
MVLPCHLREYVCLTLGVVCIIFVICCRVPWHSKFTNNPVYWIVPIMIIFFVQWEDLFKAVSVIVFVPPCHVAVVGGEGVIQWFIHFKMSESFACINLRKLPLCVELVLLGSLDEYNLHCQIVKTMT